MIILVIIATIVAWKRGWGKYSLIPAAAVFSFGFWCGVYEGYTGHKIITDTALLIGDIHAFVALVILAIKGRKIPAIAAGNTEQSAEEVAS